MAVDVDISSFRALLRLTADTLSDTVDGVDPADGLLGDALEPGNDPDDPNSVYEDKDHEGHKGYKGHEELATPVILNPPEGSIIDRDSNSCFANSIDKLLEYLNSFAKGHGFAIAKINGSNKRKTTGEYCYYTLYYDRDKIWLSKSYSLRKASTRKNDCK